MYNARRKVIIMIGALFKFEMRVLCRPISYTEESIFPWNKLPSSETWIAMSRKKMKGLLTVEGELRCWSLFWLETDR